MTPLVFSKRNAVRQSSGFAGIHDSLAMQPQV